ncbi:MAG TPA: ATP-binding protein [Blastocatellia bacterium]|nr:ATP-binding protein [Blastocatellia bacterium]
MAYNQIETADLPSTKASLPEHWVRLSQRFGTLNYRLLRELDSYWGDLQSILEDQFEQLRLPTISVSMNPIGLDAFRRLRAKAVRRLLIDPLKQWERCRPYRRAMLAIESYDRGLEELGKSLPETIKTSGPQVLELLGPLVTTGMARRFAGLRRQERQLPLRAIVIDEFQQQAQRRARVEGQYLLALIEAVHQLQWNWEVQRKFFDTLATGESLPEEEAQALKSEAKNSAEFVKQAGGALSDWRKWTEIATQRLAQRVLDYFVPLPEVTPMESDARRTVYLTHWSEQLGALKTEVKLELAMGRSEDRILRLAQRHLDSLTRERTGLLTEIENFIGWLRQRLANQAPSDFPPHPQTNLDPAASRLTALDTGLKSELQRLPGTVRIRTRFSVLPRRRTKTKELYPATTAYTAFMRHGREQVSNLLRSVEAEHQQLVWEIERARKVVEFGLSADENGQPRDPQVAVEALQKALLLLRFHRRKTSRDLTDIEGQLMQTIPAIFNENRLVLGRYRLGALAYLGQSGGEQPLLEIGRQAGDTTKQWLRRSAAAVSQATHRLLVKVDLRPEEPAAAPEIVNRQFLPQELTTNGKRRELPAIYQGLFRCEALTDPRFLVGREREMEAITQARAKWQTGRPAAVLIIGERGSGKTSLINCAIKRPLEGLKVVRGEFNERLSSATQLREFLANLMGAGGQAQLEAALNGAPRVVILEELERSFLRQIGHYSALRELQRLIAATCRTTLWIVVTNQSAFQFLNASVALGQSFSHHINATGASREALREAIMLRHNLSGLRLQFSSSPADRTLADRIRNPFRAPADPEHHFFDQVAKESSGTFRAAFELWVNQINSVKAGVLKMRPVAALDLSPVIEALDLDDLFTLMAILQHGSLTLEEHAVIFQKSVPASQAKIDGLRARGIIEPDPDRYGFRVRPESLRMVKEALLRRNLS